MGECVVACVCTADCDACDGDWFVGADVLVCKSGGRIGCRESHCVGTLLAN